MRRQEEKRKRLRQRVAAAAKALRMCPNSIYLRLGRGWGASAFTTPSMRQPRETSEVIECWGMRKTIPQWADWLEIAEPILRRRLAKMPVREALEPIG